ncbi:hypothetical protein [Syntrophotalea acetylenica]|jgi:hypothetical protein|uniref:hypothetical protein n=1 Tax=Syntrophotalea acetylenica TaxID=29542 RepID=UPI002A364873|nr:hypothetical protein [Syntrophotalea acetylenica]MDY0261649.1 hypothetical protein [Syntrophotalea acetylenica]
MAEDASRKQWIAACLQLGAKGSDMLKILLEENLPDGVAQQGWRDFDRLFQTTCITEKDGNVALDNEAFTAFAKAEHLPLLQKGVQIYNGCVRALGGAENHDCRVFKCLTQLYLSAQMVLKFQSRG